MTSHALINDRNTILFDLDGTLIDNFVMMRDSLSATMVAFGYPALTNEVFGTLLGMGEPHAIRKLGVPEEQLKQIITHRRGLMKELASTVELFDGVCELIQKLSRKGCILGIVTGSTRDWVEIIPAAQKIISEVELLVTANDTEELKPHPAPIQCALDRLEKPAHDAVYIGDGPHDIEAAHRAGCLSFLASWNHHDVKHKFRYQPDFVVCSVKELDEILIGNTINS